MKAILISAALLVPLAAFANDETYNIEKKADTKATEPPKDKADDMDKAADAEKAADKAPEKDKVAVEGDLTQSQLLNKLHKVSVGHTEMGNLAQTRGKDDRVQKLGKDMAKDFGKLDQQVIGYAKDHDIMLSDATGMFGKKPTEKTGEAKEAKPGITYEELGKLQGVEFDNHFLAATIDGCERFIPVLEGAKGKFDDMKFDMLLNKSIATLKGYQKDAEKLQGKQEAPPAS